MVSLLKSTFSDYKELSIRKQLFILFPIIIISIIGIMRGIKVGNVSDFYVFYLAGKNFIAGSDLYLLKDQARQFLYPPFAAFLFSLIFFLPFKISAVIWSFFSVLLWILNVIFAKNIIEKDFNHKLKANYLILGCLFTFNIFLDNINLLQVNSLIFFILLLAFYFYQNNKKLATSILIALAISIKVTPLLFLVWMVLRNEKKLLFYTVLFLLIFNVSPIFIRGYNTFVNDFYQFINTIRLTIPDINSGYQDANYSLRSLAINFSLYFGLNSMYKSVFINGLSLAFLTSYVSWLIFSRLKNINKLAIDISATFLMIPLFSAFTEKAHMVVLLFPFLSILLISQFYKTNKFLKPVLYFIGFSFLLSGRDLIGNRFAEFLIFIHFFTILIVVLYLITISIKILPKSENEDFSTVEVL